MSKIGSQDLVARTKFAMRELLGRYAPFLAHRLTNFRRLPDRVCLETVILPWFAHSPEIKRVLFVGTEWYTKPYERQFAGKEYWTLEIDPKNRRYGSTHHIVAPLGGLGDHVRADYFDAIICNGVFFTGAMDTRQEAEHSFDVCRRFLAPGGWFVLGWNDVEQYRPYPPAESESLARFERTHFPPLGTDEFLTNTDYRHTFSFYRKPS